MAVSVSVVMMSVPQT